MNVGINPDIRARMRFSVSKRPDGLTLHSHLTHASMFVPSGDVDALTAILDSDQRRSATPLRITSIGPSQPNNNFATPADAMPANQPTITNNPRWILYESVNFSSWSLSSSANKRPDVVGPPHLKSTILLSPKLLTKYVPSALPESMSSAASRRSASEFGPEISMRKYSRFQDELWFFWVGVILGVLTQVALDYFGWWPA